MEYTETKSLIYMVFKLIIVGGAIIFLLGLYDSAFSQDLDTQNLEKLILTPRIVQAVSYQDLYTNRTYMYIVDLDKFNQTNLNPYFSGAYNQNYGFMVSIYDMNNKKLKEDLYYNKEFYEYAQPLAFSEYFDQINVTKYVFIKKDSKLEKALLKIIFVFQ